MFGTHAAGRTRLGGGVREVMGGRRGRPFPKTVCPWACTNTGHEPGFFLPPRDLSGPRQSQSSKIREGATCPPGDSDCWDLQTAWQSKKGVE